MMVLIGCKTVHQAPAANQPEEQAAEAIGDKDPDQVIAETLEKLETAKTTLGKDHPEYAKMCHELAWIYKMYELTEKAEPLFLEAIELRKTALGPAHVDTVDSVKELADLYILEEKPALAEPMLLATLESLEQEVDINHADLGDLHAYLGYAYKNMDRNEDAIAHYLKAQGAYKSAYGMNSLQTADVLLRLGELYSETKEYEKGEEFLLSSLGIYEQIQGKNSADAGILCDQLGSLYKRQKEYDKAITFYKRTLDIDKKNHGRESIEVAIANYQLGRAYRLQGDMARAEKCFLRDLEISQWEYGRNHHDVGLTCYQLGRLYKEMEDYGKAESFLRRAVRIYDKEREDNYPNLGSTYYLLAQVYHRQGDLAASDDTFTPQELSYGLMLPIHVYPLFENAIRYHEGLSVEAHKKELGDFLSHCSSIAAKNDNSWFPRARTSNEIVEISKTNRMVSFPYTKAMCSIMQVDQAAALFMTNERTAKEMGVPRDKWIYLLGSGDAWDIWHVLERVNFHSSPSVRAAADKAMEQAGVSLEEIDFLDFYSCFPCVPRITRNMLGIPKSDPRPLTMTGSMPYFGGPGNNYSMHAICKMVETLRQNPTRAGLVHAMSWFLSKHSIGIYSGTPRAAQWQGIPPSSYQKELDKIKGPAVVERASGKAVVETFTTFYDKVDRVSNVIIIGRLEDGSRFISKAAHGEGIAQMVGNEEIIGLQGEVRFQDGFNIFHFKP